MTATFDVLLIEDNPGDARLIEEMLRDAEELVERIDAGEDDPVAPAASADATAAEASAAGGGAGDASAETTVSGMRIHHETRLADGLDWLGDADPAVILLDLNLPDSAGIETLETVSEATDRIPIVVLTGLADSDVGTTAIQRGADEYLVKDDVTADLLVRSIHHAIERRRASIERERRREQLESLNRLNSIAQDVSHAVIRSATREELEQTVCERLVADDGYRFAWIGEVQRGNDRVAARVSAGEGEGYLDAVSITADDAETAVGPTGRAIRSDEVHVSTDIETDASFERWREIAREQGFRSSAAIPIVYEGLRYGVINVYSSEPETFTGPEVDILGGLGDIVGHAIAAIERREALLSDVVLELEFRVDGICGPLASLTSESDARLDVHSIVDGDDATLAYGTVANLDRDRFLDAASETDAISDVRVLSGDDRSYDVECELAWNGDLFETVATHGGRVASITVAGGEVRLVTAFPRGRDTRQLIDLIVEASPSAEFVAQRTSQRAEQDVAELESLLQILTERQHSVLETAYFAGYFDWPRASSGEEVAEKLGISSATYSQHLRAAEQKLFGAVFDSSGDDED